MENNNVIINVFDPYQEILLGDGKFEFNNIDIRSMTVTLKNRLKLGF